MVQPFLLLSISSAERRRFLPIWVCSWKRRGACIRSSATLLRRCFTKGRLHPREGLEHQKIEGHPWLGESGLWFVPVHHEGNQNASAEEVECIASLVASLVQTGVNWVDDKGTEAVRCSWKTSLLSLHTTRRSPICGSVFRTLEWVRWINFRGRRHRSSFTL